MPAIFSKILVPLCASYSIQLAAAAVFVPLQTEKYYDFMGAVGHVSTAVISLLAPDYLAYRKLGGSFIHYRPSLTSFAPRQLLVTACLGIWATRLGYFLYSRVKETGKDSRFDDVKTKPSEFLFWWMMQGTWVAITGLPIWIVNSVPSRLHKPLGIVDLVALGLLTASLAAETMADEQKRAWRQAKKRGDHEEKFIQSGIWAYSRHPNYVAEASFQASLFLLASGSLSWPQGILLGSISPLFTYGVLRYLSGVPPLERSADKKWGDDPKWKEYKRTVPVFWPWG